MIPANARHTQGTPTTTMHHKKAAQRARGQPPRATTGASKKLRRISTAVILFAAMGLLGISPATAAIITWDGGSGTWNTTTASWNAGAYTWTNSGSETAQLGDGADSGGLVTLSQNILAAGLDFAATLSGNYTLTASAPTTTLCNPESLTGPYHP